MNFTVKPKYNQSFKTYVNVSYNGMVILKLNYAAYDHSEFQNKKIASTSPPYNALKTQEYSA
jgi:hypothetical protein